MLKILSIFFTFNAAFSTITEHTCDLPNKCSIWRISQKSPEESFLFLHPSPDSVKTFKVDSANIPSWNNKICQTFPNVLEVQLNADNITEIASDAFEGCEKITKLRFYDNPIKEIHSRLFGDLKNLIELEIERSEIEEVAPETLENLTNLEILKLDSNKILKLHPTTFVTLRNLKELTIKFNNISKIEPRTLETLLNLRILSFQGCFLDKIESTAFQKLQSLKDLNLQYNLIETIEDGSFRNLKSLDSLWLRGNRLRLFDPNLLNGMGQTLSLLDLESNTILELDVEKVVSLVPKLEYLLVNDNNLFCDSPGAKTTLKKLHGTEYVLFPRSREEDPLDVDDFLCLSNAQWRREFQKLKAEEREKICGNLRGAGNLELISNCEEIQQKIA